MRRSRRGAQAIEFALLLPVLLVITAGVIEYGAFFVTQNELINITGEAVRQGSMALILEDPEAIALATAQETIEATGLDPETITIETEILGSVPDLALRVTVEMQYSSMVGMVPVPETTSSSLTARLWYQPEAGEPSL